MTTYILASSYTAAQPDYNRLRSAGLTHKDIVIVTPQSADRKLRGRLFDPVSDVIITLEKDKWPVEFYDEVDVFLTRSAIDADDAPRLPDLDKRGLIAREAADEMLSALTTALCPLCGGSGVEYEDSMTAVGVPGGVIAIGPCECTRPVHWFHVAV